jgi:hypothetical protein
MKKFKYKLYSNFNEKYNKVYILENVCLDVCLFYTLVNLFKVKQFYFLKNNKTLVGLIFYE